MCLESSSLATEQPGCADRGPEFPRQNRLAPRPVEGLSKKLLCRRYGVVAPLQSHEFTFDPKQLGHTPTFLLVFGSFERFVDYGETLDHLPSKT